MKDATLNPQNPCRYTTLLGIVFLFLSICLFGFCDIGPVDQPSQQLLIFAGNDTIVAPATVLVLQGTARGGAEPLEYAWRIEGNEQYQTSNDGNLVVTVPPAEDSSFICILKVTDNRAVSVTDTLVVWVTASPGIRVKQPNGGEVFRQGDTLTIEMWRVYGSVGIKLAIGQWLWTPPSLSQTYNPLSRSEFSFVIPVSFTEEMWDEVSGSLQPVEVSTVSDDCRVQIFSYNAPSIYDESDRSFSIVAGGAGM